jgi:hypothetical protein
MDEIRFGRAESAIKGLEKTTTDHEYKIAAYHKRLHDVEDDMDTVKEKLSLLHDLPERLNTVIEERRNGEKWFNRIVIAGLLGLVFALVSKKFF